MDPGAFRGNFLDFIVQRFGTPRFSTASGSITQEEGKGKAFFHVFFFFGGFFEPGCRGGGEGGKRRKDSRRRKKESFRKKEENRSCISK